VSGTLDVMQRIYLGTEIRDGTLHFTPRLIDRLDGLSFPITFRDTTVRVTIRGRELTVTALSEGRSRPITVGVAEERVALGPSERAAFALTRLASSESAGTNRILRRSTLAMGGGVWWRLVSRLARSRGERSPS
jgi:hypothetical protein